VVRHQLDGPSQPRRSGQTGPPEPPSPLDSPNSSSHPSPAAHSALSVEAHSINFVPLTERYGTPRRLFTVWFSTNMTILGVALGTLGVEAGLSLGWALTALIVGNAAGTVFMAAHSAQGPQLGVPQMIQSRAQFGVRGAALPLLAVVVTYILYCAANGILIQSVIGALLPIGPGASLVLFSAITVLVAFVGYELIHRLGAILTVVSSVLFATGAYLLWSHHTGGPQSPLSPAPPHFTAAAFMLTATQAAAWSLSYGPYVADYSRYLPPTVPTAKTFWYTGLGCFLGSLTVMAFGAYLAILEPALSKDPGVGVAKLFGPAQPLAQLIVLLGIVQGNVFNLYSAYMSTVTAFTSVRGTQRIRRIHKLQIMIALIALSAVISVLANDHFQAYFADALNAMIYLLVPWSAINLADYYLVHHGHYNIAALYSSEAEYGAYRWTTIGVYCLGIAIQAPFMDLSFYKGPVAQWLGCDVAWLPGLLLPGAIHLAISKYGGLSTEPPQTPDPQNRS
jgi:nucleobase:cation symporter-1, NCS1 family